MAFVPQRRSIGSVLSFPLLGSVLVTLPLLGCTTADPPNTDSVRQRMEKVASCVYDHVRERSADDNSLQPSLSWNADASVATIAVRDSTSVRATYRVERRWDTVSIESQVTDLAANEANVIAQEATMHEACLSAGGF